MRKNRSAARHRETHRSGRGGWLRAMVLGSNDAIVSSASLMIGVAASDAPKEAILVAGVAGLVAGSMSMAVGEFVSVSSQADAQGADLAREKEELETQPQAELRELAAIYEKRGLDRELAHQVAVQLSEHDRLGAHLRDELGIDEKDLPKPLQAAWVSAASFALFALVPILALILSPPALRIGAMSLASLVSLAFLGALGARLGGGSIVRAAARVTIGGALAMAVTALVGHLFGVVAG